MGTHCLTEVTSKNIMKFWPLQLSSCLVFVPCWPCLIQCPIHTHMPCLMNPGMLHLHMVEPSVESISIPTKKPCAVVSATNCKTCKPNCAKKNDVELPPLPPKVYKNPRYYQFRNNIRIQHELTTKKVNEIVIRNSKLKR